jgi:hypothetical protein
MTEILKRQRHLATVEDMDGMLAATEIRIPVSGGTGE